jgi:hypothetical protein
MNYECEFTEQVGVAVTLDSNSGDALFRCGQGLFKLGFVSPSRNMYFN